MKYFKKLGRGDEEKHSSINIQSISRIDILGNRKPNFWVPDTSLICIYIVWGPPVDHRLQEGGCQFHHEWTFKKSF